MKEYLENLVSNRILTKGNLVAAYEYNPLSDKKEKLLWIGLIEKGLEREDRALEEFGMDHVIDEICKQMVSDSYYINVSYQLTPGEEPKIGHVCKLLKMIGTFTKLVKITPAEDFKLSREFFSMHEKNNLFPQFKWGEDDKVYIVKETDSDYYEPRKMTINVQGSKQGPVNSEFVSKLLEMAESVEEKKEAAQEEKNRADNKTTVKDYRNLSQEFREKLGYSPKVDAELKAGRKWLIIEDETAKVYIYIDHWAIDEKDGTIEEEFVHMFGFDKETTYIIYKKRYIKELLINHPSACFITEEQAFLELEMGLNQVMVFVKNFLVEPETLFKKGDFVHQETKDRKEWVGIIAEDCQSLHPEASFSVLMYSPDDVRFNVKGSTEGFGFADMTSPIVKYSLEILRKEYNLDWDEEKKELVPLIKPGSLCILWNDYRKPTAILARVNKSEIIDGKPVYLTDGDMKYSHAKPVSSLAEYEEFINKGNEID